MTTARSSAARGFALVIVMLVIVVLGLLAGAFALSMKVESRLAANANNDAEMEWLGRSGVELARFVVANSGGGAGPNVWSLNQIWAGGPGAGNETNGPLAGISLKNYQLGSGRFSVTIRDLERKWNINAADEPVLRRALTVVGVGAADASTIVDSILDWEDANDDPRMSGAESDFYRTKNPPYFAKNGWVDDLAELLLVNGVTPEIYWGPNAPAHAELVTHLAGGAAGAGSAYPVGLADLFTPISMGRINLNTASAAVLQVLPGVDENIAANIIRARAGPDGVEGTEDDTPIQSPAALATVVPGLGPQAAAALGSLAGVQSLTFEVTVEAQIGNYQKRFVAIIQRSGVGPGDVRTLEFSPQ
jgi:general secretion pathway protein K